MNTILHKRSATAGDEPTSLQLLFGEFAINMADGRVFIKKINGSVIEITQPLYTIDGGLLISETATDTVALLAETGEYLFTEQFLRIIVDVPARA